MKKIPRSVKLLLAFLTVSGILIVYINSKYEFLWNANKMKATVDDSLDLEKVTISLGFPSAPKVIFKGKSLEKIDNRYGENDFTVNYDSKFSLKFRHFKLNCNHQHNYHFHLYKKKEKLYLKVDIEGSDELHWTREMIPRKTELPKGKFHLISNQKDTLTFRSQLKKSRIRGNWGKIWKIGILNIFIDDSRGLASFHKRDRPFYRLSEDTLILTYPDLKEKYKLMESDESGFKLLFLESDPKRDESIRTDIQLR